jgi:TPR repeat protein
MMKINKISSLLVMALVGLTLSGCANLWWESDISSTSEVVQETSVQPTDGFIDVLPDFEMLDPLYDLGFEGDFDKGLAAFNDERYNDALIEWYPLAKDNDHKAEYQISIMFLNGLGVPVDFRQGAIWLQRSASKNYAQAQFELGKLYIAGQRIKQNYDQGIRWLLSAARQSHAGAQFNLGLLYQSGSVPLSSDLMAVYEESSSPELNLQQAVKWYKLSADQGHGAAQNNLAALYFRGKGIEQSNELALKWYTEAANQDVIDAQYNLGLLNEQGIGTILNLEEALFWHSKAANQGYFPSQQRLPFLYQQIETFNNSLTLYGTTLAATTRDVMRAKLKSNAATTLREQDDYWFDIYESSKLLDKTDRLFVGYSLQTDQVASLEYRFPSQNNPSFILSIIEMITKKYGPPHDSQGDLSFGKVQFSWEIKDTRIKVTRYWPDTTVYLSYYIGQSYQDMIKEMPVNAEELIYNMTFETY